MGQSVTIDVQAKIVGYLESLAKLSADVNKLDLGSKMGKDISKAFASAQALVKDLAKNMFPKASSDTQIDAIIDKANRAGDAIQLVSSMMLLVLILDLDLGKAGGQLGSFASLVAQLENELNTKLSLGMRDAISNSTELKLAFSDLGIDASKSSILDMFDGIRLGAKEAERDVSRTERELTRMQENLDLKLSALDRKMQEPLGSMESRDSYLALLDLAQKAYDTKIEEIRTTMSLGLHSLMDPKGEGALADLLLDNFLSGLTPQNLLTRITDLFSTLADLGFVTNLRGDFYTKIFGAGPTDNINSVLKSLNIEGIVNAVREAINRVFSETNLRGEGGIQRLLNDGDIDDAADRTAEKIRDGYNKLVNEIKKGKEEVILATERRDNALTRVETAQARSHLYTQAEIELKAELERVKSDNVKLSQDLLETRQKVAELAGEEVGKMRGNAGTAGRTAGASKFPTDAAKEYRSELLQVTSAEQAISKMLGITQRWFSAYAVVRGVSKAIRTVVSDTKEFDKTITEIAIVTNKSQDDLWGLMDQYTDMARKYGASISGVYKVSQLYYQLGLKEADVMALSAETLKMARISGLDYAQSTDYMTNAIRSFKLEMSDAGMVVDTYSAIAAKSATSVSELATAMSKTASSALSVGADIQSTTAMMAVMIEATRESPENIGSAMKSIISRYGEMKENPTGIDTEGEEYSLNKVDKALLSVGISLHDTNGEFRDFDDVIMELADSWDLIDTNTQRYIATVMAGNRQQSRFLALVSSGARLKELTLEAYDSEGASLAQFLKTVDSIEYKTQQLLTSVLSLYADGGFLNLFKGLLDAGNNIILTFTNMPKVFELPLPAIAKFALLFASIANIVTTTFGLIKSGLQSLISAIRNRSVNETQAAALQEVAIVEAAEQEKITAMLRAAEFKRLTQVEGMGLEAALALINDNLPFGGSTPSVSAKPGLFLKGGLFGKGSRSLALAGLLANVAGTALTGAAMSMGEETQELRNLKALFNGLGMMALGAGMGAMFGPIGALVGGIGGAIVGAIEGVSIRDESDEERRKRLASNLETALNENLLKKLEFKSLETLIKDFERLRDTHLEGEEAAQDYIDKCNEIAEQHPDLVSGYDAEGNAIINLSLAYEKLKLAKLDVSESEKAEADAQIAAADNAVKDAEKKRAEALADEMVFAGGTTEETEERKNEISLLAAALIDYLGSFINEQYGSAIYDTIQAFALGKFTEGKGLLKTNANTFKSIQQKEGENSLFASFFPLVDTVLGLVEDIEAGLTAEDLRVLKASGELKKAEATRLSKYRSGAKSVVDSEIGELLLDDLISGAGKYSYLANYKNMSTLMTRSIAKKAQAFRDNVENEGKSYFTGEDEEFTEDFNTLNNEISSLGKRGLQSLNDFIANLGDYTADEALLKFGEFFGDAELMPTELINAIMSFYDETLTSSLDIIDSISEQLKRGRDKINVGEIISSRQETLDKLGANELLSVMSFYNDIVDATEDKSITEKTAKNIVDTYMLLWQGATSGKLREKTDDVLKLLKDSNLTTNEGILNFLTGLEDLGVSLKDLGLEDTSFDNIKFPENFSGKVQAFANKTTEAVTNFDKDLGNATKGMDLKEASNLATKLGIDLTQFRREGTKFYLDDYEAIKDHYFENYNKDIDDLLKSLETELGYLREYKGSEDLDTTANKLKQFKGNERELDELLKSMFDETDESNQKFLDSLALSTINPERLLAQLKDYIQNGKEGLTFLQYMEAHFKQEYDAYAGAANAALLHSINSAYILNGNLDAFVDSLVSEEDYMDLARELIRQEKELVKKDRSLKLINGELRLAASGTASAGKSEEALAKDRAKELADQEKAQLLEALRTGDITQLTGKLAEYSKEILDTYKSVNSSITNALFDAMEDGELLLILDEKNRGVIKDLITAHPEWFSLPEGLTADLIDLANYVNILTDILMLDEEGFKEFIDSQTLTRKERAEYMKKWHDIHYPDPQDIASKMMTSSDYLSYDAGLDLYAALKEGTETEADFYARMGIEMTNAGGRITDRVKYIQALNDLIAEILDPELRRLLEAELASTERLHSTLSKLDTQKAVEDLLKDTDEISEDSRKVLESAIGVDEAAKYFLDNKDGTHKLDVRQLRLDIENETLKVVDALKDTLLESFATIGDEAITAVESAVSLITSGTKKQSDIQKVVNAFKGKYSQAELFSYDEILDTYTLNSAYLLEYQLIQALKYAEAMDVSIEDAYAEVSKETTETLAKNIDIKSFLDAESKSGQARDKLKKLIIDAGIIDTSLGLLLPEDWQAYMPEIEAKNEAAEAIATGIKNIISESNVLTDLFESIGGSLAEETTEELASSEALKKTDEIVAKEAAKDAKKVNDEIRELTANNLINTIELGGLAAVGIMQMVATLSGKELTSAEIESAYKAQVSQIEKASEQLSLGVGSLVTGNAIQILQNAGYKLQSMGDGNTAVIELIGQISDAYAAYYQALKDSGEATLEALNNAKAKVLETKNGRDAEQHAIDALGDAAGMTYSTFGQLLTDMGIELTDDLINELESSGITEAMGGNKMRIKDFAGFARRMNWDFNSEEYLSAFSSFNDGLVELNRKNRTLVADELDKLKEARPGDWLNLTQFQKEFKKYSKNSKTYLKLTKKTFGNVKTAYTEALDMATADKAFLDLQGDLLSYGASLVDGVLRLSDDANLIGVALTLKQAATDSGIEMSALISDMVLSIVDSYTDAITNGIEGKLTNTEKLNLLQKSRDLGIELTDTDFVEGLDGFLVSAKKAIELYNRMGKLNNQSLKKIYKSLSTTLKTSNSNYKTATSLLSHLIDMQSELDDLSNLNNKNNDERIKQLEEEIALAKELHMASLTLEDDSWNFMSNDAIPASIDNALNYFLNWGEARTSLGKWGMAGKSDLNLFASLLKHVLEVADATGKSVQFMGKTITENTYNDFLDNLWDMAEYNSKSNTWELSNAKLKSVMGFNMLLGSTGISKSLKDAIDNYVDINAKMLQDFDEFTGGLAEIYKSFKKAGNKHSFEDFLDENGAFNYEDFEKLLKQDEKAWKNFENFTKKVKIDGKNYATYMAQAGKTFTEGSLAYKTIKSIIGMAMSDSWDLESDYQAIADLLTLNGANNVEVTLGDITLYASEGSVIIKKGKGKNTKYVDPYGGEHDTIQDAQDSINRHLTKELKELWHLYTLESENSDRTNIELDNVNYTVTYGKDSLGKATGNVTLRGENGEVYQAGSTAGAITKVYNAHKYYTGSRIIKSRDVWNKELAGQRIEYNRTYNKTGTISALARTLGLALGLNTLRGVESAWNKAIETVGKNNNIEITSSNWEKYSKAVADEFYAMTDIPLDASQMNFKMEGNLAKGIAKLVDMTQTARDVMDGLNEAFSATGEGSVSESISNAITKAISGTGEDGKVPIEFEGKTENIPPEYEENLTGSIDYTGNIISLPTVPTLTGTILYSGKVKGTLGGCFVAGTLIIMSDYKMKNIEDIQIGEQVIAYNDETEQFEVRTVIKSYAHNNTPRVLNITLSNGITLGVTPGHPILTTKGWKSRDISNSRWEHNTEASWLNLGDEVIGYFGNAKVIAIKEVNIPNHYITYNIEVETCHTFLADGIVVHNAKSALATGDVGLAHAKSTLMGELGPELVVSNNRYFVVGQNGPEFVDLAEDAIVFNHIQTQSLLTKGVSSTRGRVITNERNAVAYAHGNINGGPARADIVAVNNKYHGASGVWDNGTNAVLNKAANKIGEVAEELDAFVKELDRWYTQLLKIAALEEKIAYEEARRGKIASDFYASGHDYYTSQLTSIEEYGKLIASDRALIEERSAYVLNRVSTLTSSGSPWSALYTLDSNGTMVYNSNARDIFSEKFGASDSGAPNHTSKEQYDWLMSQGFGDYLKYDKSGNEIKFTNDKGEADPKAYKTAVEAFWDKMESLRDEILEELDDIAERERAILEAQQRANEIALEMRDNLIELENKVLDAVVEIRERAISELEKLRDAYADSADKTVNGLTDALNKERLMYEMQDTLAETDRMRRRLAILQSSGGSASEIIDLQEQIRLRDRDMYFDQSQKQIDAIKEASDKEIERMDSQIELLKELLEYLKAHGLLWEAVYEVMRLTPDQITAFIAENTEEFWSYSPAKSAKEFAELNFKSEQWTDFRDKYGADLDKVIELLTSAIAAISAQLAAASDGGAGSTGGTWKQDEVGWWYEHADGSYTTNDWEKIDGKWYWFNEKGYMHTGWHQWNGGWYYLDPTLGDMLTGWIQWNGGWYYADETGKLLLNTTLTIDGKTYTFDANGLATEGGSGSSGGKTALIPTTITESGGLYGYDLDLGKGLTASFTGYGTELAANAAAENTAAYIQKMRGYDIGGMVDDNGLAYLHAREAVLTARQASILRNQILGGGRNSLMNLLLTFRDMYDEISMGSSYGMYDGGDGSVTIEHAELNMYVNEIANDYDARRAGEKALDEMLRIARRTSVMGLRR